jgi:GTPase SAR1 family protein
MGVIYVGDRAVGKTHLALELSNPRSQYVKSVSPGYDYLKSMLSDEEDSTKPTETIDSRSLELKVQLPSGSKNIMFDWIDTPGEIWRDRWRQDNPSQWQFFLKSAHQSEGILLILEPFREALPATIASGYRTQVQWCNRFENWVNFFQTDCPKVRHLVLCLNKADLFSHDLDQDAYRLAFNPRGSEMKWRERHNYVLQKYFRPIQPQIEQINKSISGLSVQCFITSIHSRPLLELPWIYMASFLAK